MTLQGEGGLGALAAVARVAEARTLLLLWSGVGFAILGKRLAGRDRRVLGVLAGTGARTQEGQLGVPLGEECLKAGDLQSLGSNECLQVGDPGKYGLRRGSGESDWFHGGIRSQRRAWCHMPFLLAHLRRPGE
jgi:hypothetical protein